MLSRAKPRGWRQATQRSLQLALTMPGFRTVPNRYPQADENSERKQSNDHVPSRFRSKIHPCDTFSKLRTVPHGRLRIQNRQPEIYYSARR